MASAPLTPTSYYPLACPTPAPPVFSAFFSIDSINALNPAPPLTPSPQPCTPLTPSRRGFKP